MSSINTKDFVVTSRYRFLIALILSLLLHMLVLTQLGPSSQSRGSVLQVRLTAPITSKTTTEAIPKVSSKAKKPEQERSQSTKAEDTSPTTSASGTTIPSNTVAAKSKNSTPPPQPVEVPRKVDQQQEVPLPDNTTPPSWVEIQFEIFSGEDKNLLGTGLHHFESNESGNYLMRFIRTARPGEDNQDDSWQLMVEGKINRKGLSPSTYNRQGSLAERLLALNEDSTASSIEIRNGRMPDSILDRQSLLYQFMFAPPTDIGGQLMLTDGKNFNEYTYRVAGMESIEIKSLGVIRTLHLILVASENLDTIELWLAPDFRYLPVRIRHTSPNKIVTDQVAVSLNFK